MSSSGSITSATGRRAAARPARARPRARRRACEPSPSRVSGSARSVAHSAAAAAPAREHSSADLAEVQVARGEVRVRRVVERRTAPTPGSRKSTQPQPYGCRPCLCGSTTIESARGDRLERRGRDAGLAAVGEQREEAAVRRVDVQPRAVRGAQVGDRARRRRARRATVVPARRRRPCPRRPARSRASSASEVHAARARPAATVSCGAPSTAHSALVRVVRVLAREDRRRPGAARARPRAPRGSRTCPRRSGARAAASKPNIVRDLRDRLPLELAPSPGRRRARGCSGSGASSSRTRPTRSGAAA